MNADQRVKNELRQWLRYHHSVIGWGEARELGASKALVLALAKRGEWVRVYRGVYRDSAAPKTPFQDLRAAFVATDERAVVSHASAAWMWNLLPQPPELPELTIPAGAGAAGGRMGFVLHRARDLDRSRAVNRETMLVTNPLRTLVDLAGLVSPSTLTAAVDAALASRLLTVAGLEAEMGRLSRQGRQGLGALRSHLADRGFIGAPNPSVLESKMRRLILSIRPLGVEPPTVELRAGPDSQYRLDLAWADLWLFVEVDGYVWHFSPEHMQRDVARRNHLQDLGWTLRVYTWKDVVQEPARVATEIAAIYHQCRLAAHAPANGGSPPGALHVGFVHGQ